MRGCQDYEGAVAVLRLEPAVSGAVGLPAALGTDVRRGDREQIAIRLNGLGRPGEVAPHGFPQGIRFGGVGGAGVCRAADRLFEESAAPLLLHAGEPFVFEEAGFAQSIDQMLLEFAHFQIPGGAHQGGAQIQVRLLAVETSETLDQQRRDDQHGIGKAERVANEQARMLRRGRGHEIEIQAKAGK